MAGLTLGDVRLFSRVMLLLAGLSVCTGWAAASTDVMTIPPGFNAQTDVIEPLRFRYRKDLDDDISIDRVLGGVDVFDDPRWTNVSDTAIPEKYSDSYYWLVTRIHNASGSFQNVIFDIPFPRAPYLEFYVKRADGSLESYETGSWREYRRRPIDYNHFAFPLDFLPDETVTVYIHTKNRPLHVIELAGLAHPVRFLEKVSSQHTFNLLYLGMLVAVTIFNLVLAIFAREKTYAYFAFFLLSTIFGLLVYLGLASRLLWPDSNVLPRYEIPLAAIFFQLALLIFVINFCDMRRSAPRIHIGLIVLTALSFLPLVGSLITRQPTHYIHYTLGVVVVPIISMAGACLWLAMRGNEPARSLLVAWSVAVVGILVWGFLRVFNLSQSFIPIELGQILLVVVLSLLVVKRITLLRDQEQRALAESQAKSEFLAQMSHEIRNPMNGVLGMTHMLKETDLNEMQRQYANTIDSSASALLVILNDILDVSKMDAGKFRLDTIAFDIRSLLEDSTRIFSLQAEDKQLDLTCDVAENVPRYVYGDPNRIRQVIVNFLSNAFKFTKSGAIAVSVSCDSVDPLRLKISVSDSGVGIPLERQGKLFERFEQVNTSDARKYGGTGLGLAICKHLSELMNGEIGVVSAPGAGATFWITFPTAEARESELPEYESQKAINTAGEKLRVLVAEDGEVNRVIIKHLIEKLGHHCEIAENGEQALDRLQQSLTAAAPAIDIVFMDGDMPVMDGLEATRRWRALESENHLPAIPVIALTAHLLPDYIEECVKSGMTAHLSKPVQLVEVQKIIQRFTGRPEAAAGSVVSP